MIKIGTNTKRVGSVEAARKAVVVHIGEVNGISEVAQFEFGI